MSEAYDIVVIGSGPGGYRAAVLAALKGQKTAIVEKHVWGGCCLNRGCVPKKDWHHSARLLSASRRFAQRGVLGDLRPDLAAAWRHQRQVVETVRGSYLNYLKRLKVERIEGEGRLQDAGTVEVAGQALSARHIILATGSTAFVPTGLQPESGRIITTDMLFDEPVPQGQRVAVVGGGVIGTEFAYILAQFGLDVVWLTGAAPLANSDFSPQARAALTAQLEQHGISPRGGARIVGGLVGDKGVRLDLDDGGSEVVDWVLLGTGRRPYTAGLGLAAAGITTDDLGFIEHNDFLQTQAANVYAIGDCTSPAMTANQALADATVAVHNIVHGNERRQSPQWVPQVIYSATELARVGMNEDQAEDAGLEPAVGFAAFETSPRALGQDASEGFTRVIADMDSGEYLGGEIVGDEAGELIHLLALAPDRETALKWLASGSYNHPARAEELLNATETMASKWGMEEFIL